MSVSRAATCLNPALFGLTLSPIEMTPIETFDTTCTPPAFLRVAAISFGLGYVTAISFGLGIVLGASYGRLLDARISCLVNKISPLNFPSGSVGEAEQNKVIATIMNYGLWEAYNSKYPQESYALLTNSQQQIIWAADWLQLKGKLTENPQFLT